jgi:3-methyladenine DNA glycosylase/8-oxoguanine DNA glycosylase
MNNEEVCQALLPLRGVGRWTAGYVLLWEIVIAL